MLAFSGSRPTDEAKTQALVADAWRVTAPPGARQVARVEVAILRCGSQVHPRPPLLFGFALHRRPKPSAFRHRFEILVGSLPGIEYGVVVLATVNHETRAFIHVNAKVSRFEHEAVAFDRSVSLTLVSNRIRYVARAIL